MHGLVLLENCSQNKDRWLELRNGKITATKAVVAAGLNPYQSPLQLWLQETGKEKDEFDGNDFTRLGQTVEPYIADLFARKHEVKVQLADAFYCHPSIPWAATSLDYWVGEAPGQGLLECKNTSYNALDLWDEDKAPDMAHAQLMWEMGVVGVEHGHCAALVGGDPRNFFTPYFKFDEALFASMVEAAEAFRRCVLADVPHAAGPGDSKRIEKMVGLREQKSCYLGPQQEPEVRSCFAIIEDAGNEISSANKVLKRAQEAKRRAENQLKLMIGNCDKGRLGDGSEFKVSTIYVNEKVVGAYSFTKLSVKEA